VEYPNDPALSGTGRVHEFLVTMALAIPDGMDGDGQHAAFPSPQRSRPAVRPPQGAKQTIAPSAAILTHRRETRAGRSDQPQ
jgi:hypothetical protein